MVKVSPTEIPLESKSEIKGKEDALRSWSAANDFILASRSVGGSGLAELLELTQSTFELKATTLRPSH